MKHMLGTIWLNPHHLPQTTVSRSKAAEVLKGYAYLPYRANRPKLTLD
jgi:hypothetical protein